MLDEVERFVWSFPEVEVLDASRVHWMEERQKCTSVTHAPKRSYPRMARVNELLREILGESSSASTTSGSSGVTITGVDCDADLAHAVVRFDSLLAAPRPTTTRAAAFGDLRPACRRRWPVRPGSSARPSCASSPMSSSARPSASRTCCAGIDAPERPT